MELQVNGKSLGLKFGLPALRRIQSKLGLTEFSDEISLTLKMCLDILYSGYLNYCLAKGVDPEISSEEIYDYLETNLNNELEFSKINECIVAFNESKYVKPSSNGEATEEQKKTLTGTS